MAKTESTKAESAFKEENSLEKRKFKEEYSLEKRKADAYRIKSKYPDRLPIIVEGAGRKLPDIDKKKFLVPRDEKVSTLMDVVRRRMNLKETEALFLHINGVMPKPEALMSTLYERYKSEDGFMYVTYSGEQTFGHTRCE
mmetsp:Transcript_17513/g.30166  ORF Transcript_17513/g.30166 Transcript_17513/m.30166 type:complete len:140 (+) Transcript_17513:88-507(+)|eukprot:CAMPEP_0196657520 /NCGR_PEP_ID=MMETSP1086-20130531/23918_1 /TAXON_ID=77921 /ORGANISM="Cyanoptyche  gloeocystis , Strain SAG4.97" /LENGTH=139 /DNA_ID=CAMNT_0041990691 /DNA_START=88 /DNA_END=507 /DNA_ORIENTATION=-